MDDEGVSRIKGWLVARHILHVNHWWGIAACGWFVYWNGKLCITRSYPHTEF